MSQHSTLRSLCLSRIAPVIAALSFTLSGQNAQATVAEGTAEILERIVAMPPYNLKPPTDLLKVKAADLVYAVALVLEDPTNTVSAADVAAGALASSGGKARADKDKIAGQIAAQAIASANLTTDGTAAANVVVALFNVNDGTKAALTAAGEGAALAGAIQALSTNPSEGNDFGTQLGAGTLPDVTTLLVNASKVLGKSAPAAQDAFTEIVEGLENSGDLNETVARAAAQKVAASNPAAAGAIYGGFMQGTATTAAAAQTTAISVVEDTKLAKARGEILAQGLANYAGTDTEKNSLAQALYENAKVGVKGAPLVAQGLLRAGSAADVDNYLTNTILGAPGKTRATLAAVVSVGNGDNEAKMRNIVTALQGGLTATDKANVNTAAINAVAALNPEAAEFITDATLDTTGIVALTLAQTTVAKIKSTAAAGFMAKAAVQNSAPATDLAWEQNTASIMAKGTKAATDIAYRVAQLRSQSVLVDFAEGLADQNKKFVLNVAVGLSLANDDAAADITVAAITHELTQNGTKLAGDTAAIAQAPKIAGAVALAATAEQATFIAQAIGAKMSLAGNTVAAPFKVSTATALATALAKSIQTKPGVKTVNREDELGEIGAVLAASIIGKFAPDAKGFTAENKAITALATALFKALSSKQLDARRTLAADRDTFFDIVGSIAKTILQSGLTNEQKTAYIGDLTPGSAAGGILANLAKLAGKAGTAANTAILNAIADAKNPANNGKFESGFDASPAVLNDPETDNRDA